MSTPSLDDLVPTLVGQGLPRSFAEEVASLARDVAAGDLAEVTTTVAELTGRPPRSAEDFLAEHAEQLRTIVPAFRTASDHPG